MSPCMPWKEITILLSIEFLFRFSITMKHRVNFVNRIYLVNPNKCNSKFAKYEYSQSYFQLNTTKTIENVGEFSDLHNL